MQRMGRGCAAREGSGPSWQPMLRAALRSCCSARSVLGERSPESRTGQSSVLAAIISGRSAALQPSQPAAARAARLHGRLPCAPSLLGGWAAPWCGRHRACSGWKSRGCSSMWHGWRALRCHLAGRHGAGQGCPGNRNAAPCGMQPPRSCAGSSSSQTLALARHGRRAVGALPRTGPGGEPHCAHPLAPV